MTKSFREIVGAQPSKVDIANSALLIIDAQNEYAEGQLKIHEVEKSRAVIKDVLQKYRSANGTIVHIVHDTPEGAPIFTPNTPLAEEFAELKPQGKEIVIHKQAPSSFTGTELHDQLTKLGKKQVVLTGYMMHVCVTGTARSAMEHGYDVIVVQDGVGDRDIPGIAAPELVKIGLLELADVAGTIVKSSEISA